MGEFGWPPGLKLLLEGIEPKVVRKRYRLHRQADASGILRA
jgi:hypothetical protein